MENNKCPRCEQRLVEGLVKGFSFSSRNRSSGCALCEGNPEDLTEGKIAAWRILGGDRWAAVILERMKIGQSYEEAEAYVTKLRREREKK